MRLLLSRPQLALALTMYCIDSRKILYSAASVRGLVICMKVSMGTQSRPNIAWDYENCVGAHTSLPSRTASRAHALMSSGGTIRMPGGYFFPFADGWVGLPSHLSGVGFFRQATEPLRRPPFREFACDFRGSLAWRVQTDLPDTFALLLM